MANLRLVRIKASDSQLIRAQFTGTLDSLLNATNVTVVSNVPGVPDAEVLKVTISNDIMNVIVRPMTPNAAYFVTFKSSQTSRFKSQNGQSFLLEDGNTNVSLLLGPEDPADITRDILLSYLDKQSILSLDNNTIARDIVNLQSKYIGKALHDIGQSLSDNYLEILIQDEKKTRGLGPYDRLNEEGAYQVDRVGRNRTATNLSTSFSYTSFPKDPITLLRTDVIKEKLFAGTIAGTFDNLILTVKHGPVTKLNKAILYFESGGSFEYDLSTLGYQIKNPNYDTNVASALFTLQDNQFNLNSAVLDNPDLPVPQSGDTLVVDYEYKSLGRIIDPNSVLVSQVLEATREAVPPILNRFILKHAPVVTDSDQIPTSDGIEFLDPQANPPFSSVHPAFKHEIPFRLEGLPRVTGDSSVDYSKGEVYVYGATTNDGSGVFPPGATYNYRKSFSNRIDYTFDLDTDPIHNSTSTGSDLVANPLRELISQSVKVSFDFEQTLVPGVDFKSQIHQEELDERIENRLTSTASFLVKNSPITNVFRIFNETSGEVYALNRFSDNTVYFTANTSPRIIDKLQESIKFTEVSNETLLVDLEFINILSTRIYRLPLVNNKIISTTDDAIGSSFNSSVSFSRIDIFEKELYYDAQIFDVATNTDRLLVGQYQIDYRNGLIYVGVTSSQVLNVGTVNYAKPTISPENPHVISVSELFYSINAVAGSSKIMDFSSFGEGIITPNKFDISDERFLNDDVSLPYIVDNGQITVTNDIKRVRHIFDAFDLNNHADITDFAEGSTSSGNVITLDSTGVEKKELNTVITGPSIVVSFISTGAELSDVTNVIRTTDNVELWDSSGTFSGYTINLSGLGSPVPGDSVLVIYRMKLNGAATPVVDYNRGDYFVNYTYLADEILVSYEHGDNVLDFRESGALNEGEEYFVTYTIGAVRDSLLKNFGTLVDLPILNTFDTSLPRENYRDALQAALQSFTKGPTIPAITELVSRITHVDPEIIESVFDIWSLGISHLFQNAVDWTGDIALLPGKFDNGALIANPDETITFPISSNFKLEEGTWEAWVIPEWDGLDNDSTLTISLTKDGYVLPASSVFIGASSFNPIYDSNNSFSINRNDELSPLGLPSAIFTKTGVFIFYNTDTKHWEILAKDVPIVDGYAYRGEILTSGEFYDVGFKQNLGEPDDVLRTLNNKIQFTFNLNSNDADGYADGYDGYTDGYVPGFSFDGIIFMSDDKHYIFDFAKTNTTNRFSIFKDGKGYLNFQTFSKGNPTIPENPISSFKISSDISDWKSGQKHHIAASWRLSSVERRDEMHLFIDGFEVPNLLRYGGRPIATSTDRFRTISAEIVAGTVPLTTITNKDLNVTNGSSIVFSDSVNFQTSGILPGDTIDIIEIGFGSYNITAVNGYALTLNLPMPATLSNVRFSVNPYSVVVSSEINLSSNIAVSIISGLVETEIPGLRADIPSYSIGKNLYNQDVLTLLGNAIAGDQIVIRTLGLNHRRARSRQFVWGDTTSILRSQLPPPINLDEAKITAILLPSVVIGPGNAVIFGNTYTAAGLAPTQTSNSTEGRRLSVYMTGGNINFSTPATVTVFGTTFSGAVFEIFTFTASGAIIGVEKFKTITSATAVMEVFNPVKNSASIEIKEAYSITEPDGNNNFPIVRFSFKTAHGITLQGDGSAVITDSQRLFLDSDIGNKLAISSPALVVGTYNIVSRPDEHTLTISPAPGSAFTDGIYDIFDISLGRSGFQNGFFTFELAGSVDTDYPLKQGVYELDYSAHLEIPFAPTNDLTAYVGSNFNGGEQAKAIIDEVRILSNMLTDVRVGEILPEGQDSITSDFTSLRPFDKNSKTLMLLHLDEFPFNNDSDYYISSTKEFIQSSDSVNETFNQSVVIMDKPLIYDNNGYLPTTSEGTIEFWVSPKFDTFNDPNVRVYFDAASSSVEKVTSITSGSVKTAGRISTVLAVRLQTDVDNSGVNYFTGGRIEDDFQTIKLGIALPYQQTPVKIIYITSGLVGNRITIFKDKNGFINFDVRIGDIDYKISQSIFWQRDTWHRIRVTYKFNRSDNKDELRMFVDGEENATVMFGAGLIFGSGAVFGMGRSGGISRIVADMNFTDPINQFFIGSDYLGAQPAQARFDNLKISDIALSPVIIAGQPKDVNYTSNISQARPAITDAFTTFLLDFDQLVTKNTDFAILRDDKFGIFNFTLNILDSFGIVLSNAKIEQVLRELISALKPAQSKVTINLIP